MDERDRGAELGRVLARAFRAAKPRMQKFAEQASPQVARARDEALQFAQDHDAEIKQLASRLVRSRVAGPLGMVVDAFVSQPPSKPALNLCPNCRATNPGGARFCNQCGASLQPKA